MITPPKVEILNRQGRHTVDRVRLRRVACAAFRRAEGIGDEITILLAGDRKLRTLNREYRNKDRVTDVLSFPAGEAAPDGTVHVGDIAISVSEAARQAEEEGIEFHRILDRLVTHGVLHLLGYDHEVDDGEMMALQARILDGLQTDSAS